MLSPEVGAKASCINVKPTSEIIVAEITTSSSRTEASLQKREESKSVVLQHIFMCLLGWRWNF